MICRALFHPECKDRRGEWPVDGFTTRKDRPFTGLCRKCNAAKVKQYYRDNPEKRLVVRRRVNKRSYWANAEKRRAQKLEYMKNNRQSVNRRVNNRKARLKAICQITDEQWQEILNKHGRKCLACGTDKDLTRDHVVPLSKGGEDTPKNSQPLCRCCNASKGVKTIDYR